MTKLQSVVSSNGGSGGVVAGSVHHDWLPYFGNQCRVLKFVTDQLENLNLPDGAVFAETNAGSFAVSNEVAKKFNFNILSNDVSHYSTAIGKTLFGIEEMIENHDDYSFAEHFRIGKHIDDMRNEATSNADLASIGCAIVDLFTYDLIDNDTTESEFDTSVAYWKAFLGKHSRKVDNVTVSTTDLFDFLSNNKGDVVFMDFAWPWKDGAGTEEYSKMTDLISSGLSGKACSFDLWDKSNIVDKVVDTLRISTKNFKYTILSNQSSNYPTHPILLERLEKEGFNIKYMQTFTHPASEMDDRGNDKWFTEFAYIIEGDVNE